jgi:hypothetical protein
MWKSFFLASGIFLMVLGAESLIVEKFSLTDSRRLSRLVSPDPISTAPSAGTFSRASYEVPKETAKGRTLKTREWMPWSLIAAGAITVMYTSSYGRNGRPGS